MPRISVRHVGVRTKTSKIQCCSEKVSQINSKRGKEGLLLQFAICICLVEGRGVACDVIQIFGHLLSANASVSGFDRFTVNKCPQTKTMDMHELDA